MIDGYISVKEAADKWEITPRRIQTLCGAGRIKGASKLGREWAIPITAEKPNDMRITTGKYKDWRNTSGNKATVRENK